MPAAFYSLSLFFSMYSTIMRDEKFSVGQMTLRRKQRWFKPEPVGGKVKRHASFEFIAYLVSIYRLPVISRFTTGEQMIIMPSGKQYKPDAAFLIPSSRKLICAEYLECGGCLSHTRAAD